MCKTFILLTLIADADDKAARKALVPLDKVDCFIDEGSEQGTSVSFSSGENPFFVKETPEQIMFMIADIFQKVKQETLRDRGEEWRL